ncbi:MAG TPA: ATP-binding protein, partial [Anaerolineae bacterium]|nr:ATP-binding protein [Anaerolineae bacterium]
MANQYVLSNIRAFLTEGFTAEELRRFCYDEPDFRPVYDHLAVNSSKAEIVDQLLEHAERKRLIDKLLIWAKENNSAAYEEYQPYRDIPPLGPPSNPFFFGGPVLPENFVGHRQAVEFCHDKFTARQPANIAVSGERRIGKTSLLHYLHKFGPQEAWGQHLCLFLDCGVFGGSLTPSTFWREMLHLLRHSLDPTSSILHQVIDLAAQPNLSGQDFRRLLNNYYRLYPQQFVVLLLDEFELIFQNYNSDVETLLNDLR